MTASEPMPELGLEDRNDRSFKLLLGKRMIASSADEREQLEADALASRPA